MNSLDVVTWKKTKLNRSTSQQSEPFPIWTENSALLHRKKQSWSVPHPNRLNCFPYVSWHPSNCCDTFENWSVPHPNRLNRLLYRKKQNWAVPHPNRLNCLNAEWWMMMDDEWSRPSCVTESTESVYFTKGKTLFHSNLVAQHIPTDWTDVITSKKTKVIRSTSQQTEPFPIWTDNSMLLHRKGKNRSVSHPSRLNLFRKYHKS